MKADDYEFLCALVFKGSGLSLGAGKEYLFETRLPPVTASLGFADIGALVAHLRKTPDPKVQRTICEAMATHESLFFRDGAPFDELRAVVLPTLIEARRSVRRLRIWCAAASTGQEPYSIVMTLLAHFPTLADWSVDVRATDMSRAAIERGRVAIYNQFEIQRGLPITMLMKFFKQVPEGWQLDEAARKRVTWGEQNLLADFRGLGRFDIVFCRNVLIYFDQPTKSAVLARLADVVAPDGYLFLGGAESVLGLTEAFVKPPGVKTSLYRRHALAIA